MSKESGEEWVFDSLVGFLRGPVWNVPILTFIEHKSLIFEVDNEENEGEYKKIHDEYKNLVDFMLGSYMEDIGISPKQFETACTVASKKIKSQFHHALFEQVWAADDYEIFKRMMIQKNIELQLQALELLQQRYGVSLKPEKGKKRESDSEAKVMEEVVNAARLPGGDEKGAAESEQEVISNVIKRSIAEHEAEKDAMDKENQELAEALAKSEEEHIRLRAQKDSQQALMAEHFKTKVSIEDPSVVLGSSSASGGGGASEEIDPEELKRRTEFLKAQRDKLLAMKKVERERQLADAEKSAAKSRPKSARAARSAFGRGRSSPQAQIDPETLRVRKALAEKLKHEVIGK